ncbi:MAG: hypothetical protein ACI4RJ_04905 [Alphaproteobacteria bacterium]
MLIKCKNCSKNYDVSEEKLRAVQPRFFKCSACGCMFETGIKNKQLQNIMPLAENFTEQPNTLATSKGVNENADSHIFEPVKIKKQMPWSKIVVGMCACITTVICVLCMITVARLYLIAPAKTPIQSKDFSFNNTQFYLTDKNNLLIQGNLLNKTKEIKKAPFVLILIKNKKEKELLRQYKSIKRQTLDAQEQIPFYIGVENIPSDSFKVEILTEERA